MAVAWFLAPYVRRPHRFFGFTRSVAVRDHHAAILADGGTWAETEVLGQHAIVKVRASASTLAAIAVDPGITRIPLAALDDQLASLSTAQKNAIRSRVQALGYSLAELNARFPNDLGTYTLRELLLFIARRRRKVRYDAGSDTIFDDGPEQPVRPLAEVDAAVA